MRASLTIDDTLYNAIRDIAAAKRAPVEAVVDEVVRLGLESSRPLETRNGFPLFPVPPGAPPIDDDVVRRAEDEF